MHLDIAGVGGVADNTPYLEKGEYILAKEVDHNINPNLCFSGMSGRPTRTLINLLSRISKKNMF